MNTFIIPAHGVNKAPECPELSYAQYRLLHETKPIRLCGSPTGAGKTYAFIEAARQRQSVLFVVPTQTLADDIQVAVTQYNVEHKLPQPIHTAIWDGRQSKCALQEGKLPWGERQADFLYVQNHGGMIIATLEALARLTMGLPGRQHIRLLDMSDVLWRFDHLVIDEAHMLNTRAFGLLHLWITIVACIHKRNHISTKLTLLSATHSNLLKDLLEERYLPSEYIAVFDEQVSEVTDSRFIHGDVTVHVHDYHLSQVIATHVKPSLQEKGKILLIYDNLIQMRKDMPALKKILCYECQLDPSHIIMINGQDRQVEQMNTSGDAFATGTQPQPHHQVIIGTSAVEMGVNFQVDAAIIEPGRDAAALLQRIGRVARGHQSGIVHVSKPHREVSHFIKLQQCQNIVPVSQLRDLFGALRKLNTRIAKELGRAYWSMLRRQNKHLMEGIEEAFIDLMGEDVPVPGKLLDSLWIAKKLHFRKKREFMAWLDAIDRSLQDVRGFAPTIKVRFQDRSFTYSRDWITQHLRAPDAYDQQEETYVYHDALESCLRERARPLECQFFHPGGKTDLMSAWTLPSPDLWKDYKRIYLNLLKFPIPREDRELYERTTGFIEATRLLPRADEKEGVLIDSEIASDVI